MSDLNGTKWFFKAQKSNELYMRSQAKKKGLIKEVGFGVDIHN